MPISFSPLKVKRNLIVVHIQISIYWDREEHYKCARIISKTLLTNMLAHANLRLRS
jgi:hypothetical protein